MGVILELFMKCLLLIATSLCSRVVVRHVAAATELSSSAILFYNSEWLPNQKSLCQQLVTRAKTHGGNRVNIVPTLYYVDLNSTGPPGEQGTTTFTEATA